MAPTFWAFSSRQAGTPGTVQGELEEATARADRSSEARVVGSGRTDAGVHAVGQVVGFRALGATPTSDLHRALNAVLPRRCGDRAGCRRRRRGTRGSAPVAALPLHGAESPLALTAHPALRLARGPALAAGPACKPRRRSSSASTTSPALAGRCRTARAHGRMIFAPGWRQEGDTPLL